MVSIQVPLWHLNCDSIKWIEIVYTGYTYISFIVCTVLYSTMIHLPHLRIQIRRMLGSSPGLLRLRQWQSDALTIRLDLIHFWNYMYIFHKTCQEKDIKIPETYVINIWATCTRRERGAEPPILWEPFKVLERSLIFNWQLCYQCRCERWKFVARLE